MAKGKTEGAGVEVVATKDGFYKAARIRAGNTFIFTGKTLGKWMKQVGKAEVKVEEPETTDKPAE